MVTDGYILSQVFENGDYSEQQRKSTLHNAKRIYDRLPNPNNDIESNVGIVVGRVQSGKTANVITLSALALDNGHKMVVLFLSDTNNLLTQNTDRFMTNFKDIDGVEVVKKSKDGTFDTTLDAQTLEALYEDDIKLVICSLKHAKHINDINNLISQSPYKNDYALIIDDEGDDIGLNTVRIDDKFVEDNDGNLVESERTATNKAIIGLKETMTKLGYISLTATPEANILLQDFQQLAPDYCVTLEPNNGYTGLVAFHGEGSDKVVEIKDYCNLLEDGGLPKSFNNAFIFFLAGCMIRKKREGGKKFKHSMMVHPDHRIGNHEIVYNKVEDYISKIFYNLEHNNQSAERFIESVKKQYDELDNQGDFEPANVLKTLKKLKRHLVNNASSNNDLKQAMKLLPYHIVIGGNMLDRGITIDGLAVSYMIRMSKVGQADTLLQRARWFGYKQSYFDLCKVYLPHELKVQFANLIEIEESVWEFLYECDHNNLSPKETSVYLQMPEKMRIAATNKASYIATNLISFSKSQSILVHNKKRNADNVSLINKFDWAKADIKSYTTSQVHRMKTVSVDVALGLVNEFHFSEEDDSMNREYLLGLIKRLGAKEVDIWDMRYKEFEHRTFNQYRVSALLQGRSQDKNPSDPDYYIGDRQLKTNNLSIQIHHVILKNDIDDQYQLGDDAIMLAAILPNGYIGGYAARKMTHDEIKDYKNRKQAK